MVYVCQVSVVLLSAHCSNRTVGNHLTLLVKGKEFGKWKLNSKIELWSYLIRVKLHTSSFLFFQLLCLSGIAFRLHDSIIVIKLGASKHYPLITV